MKIKRLVWIETETRYAAYQTLAKDSFVEVIWRYAADIKGLVIAN